MYVNSNCHETATASGEIYREQRTTVSKVVICFPPHAPELYYNLALSSLSSPHSSVGQIVDVASFSSKRHDERYWARCRCHAKVDGLEVSLCLNHFCLADLGRPGLLHSHAIDKWWIQAIPWEGHSFPQSVV